MKHVYVIFICLFLCTCVRAQTYVSVTEQDQSLASVIRILQPSVPAEYDVTNYKVLYRTIDALGRPDTASGLLCIPDDPSLRFPMGIYMHGTVTDREAVPSRQLVPERLLTSAIASVGYITVAPDYIGLGDSEGFHPYVHADSESSAGRDLILAAREWMDEQGIAYNQQLFVTGYSQGGHAAQALHRDIQASPGPDSLEVTAAGHLSGPYSISDVMRRAALEPGRATLPGYIIYTYVSYNNVYGIYDDLGEAFQEPYLAAIRQFDREEIDGGRFNEVLDSLLTANDDRLIDMFQDSIRIQIETDDDDSRIVQALRDNDTYDWAPEAPTLIYYCTQDEQVPNENAILADSVMAENGSTSVTLTNGGPLTHGQCAIPAVLAALDLFETLAVRDQASSVASLLDLPELRVYPNPIASGNTLTLRGLPASTVFHFDLIDAAGRLGVRGQLSSTGELVLPNDLRNGLYLLRLTNSEGGHFTRKLIVR
jgi:pimeloyl-ACP methyl ester carboxylesterase